MLLPSWLLLAAAASAASASLRQLRRSLGAVCVSSIAWQAAGAAPIASEYYNKAETAIETTARQYQDMEKVSTSTFN